DFTFENVDAKRVENFFLDGALEGTRSVNRVVTFARDQFLGGIGKIERDLLLLEPFRQAAELNFNNLFEVVLSESIKNDNLIDPVEKFGSNMCPQSIRHQSRAGFFRFFLGDVLRADVRSHDDDSVLEIDRPPLPVGDATVIQHLQQ